MKTTGPWNKVRWIVVSSLLGGLCGALLMMASIQAGPIDAPMQKNTSSEPLLYSASYQPNRVCLLTLPSELCGEENKSIVILLGFLNAEWIPPGASTPIKAESLAFKRITEKDLDEFPLAKKLVSSETEILAEFVNTGRPDIALEQVRAAFKKSQEAKVAE